MTLFEFLSHFMPNINVGNISVIIFVLLILVEIAPIQINPWSALFKWIGKNVNADIKQDNQEVREEIKIFKAEINDRFDDVTSKVETLSKTVELNKVKAEENRELDNAKARRRRIVDFADIVASCVKKQDDFPRREKWNQILKDIKEYTDYCKSHPKFPNGEAVSSIKLIEDTFQKLLSSGYFVD